MLHSHSVDSFAFLVLGFAILLFGRKLFWLFVAGAGFLVGVYLAPHLVSPQSELLTLGVALVLGILGALLALFLQKLAIAISGFVAGGYLTAALAAPALGIHFPGAWLCFIIGGILGAILLFIFFNWALIILSSLQGAHLILAGFFYPRHYFSILFIIIALVGIFIQASTYRRIPASTQPA